MTELLKAVASWPSLLLVVVVFGFAPGFCLRLIVRAYPRDDPRRTELVAELYVVPRAKRPLWVAEQLEVALFEGLGHRISAVVRRFIARRQDGGGIKLSGIAWSSLLVIPAVVIAFTLGTMAWAVIGGCVLVLLMAARIIMRRRGWPRER